MRSTCLMIYRVCITFWLGAALFFSAVALKPIRSLEIEAAMRPRLALILFPGYYEWGLSLLTISLVAGGFTLFGLPAIAGKRRFQISVICAILALACQIGDRLFIYSHLARMMAEVIESETFSARFRSYHVASISINVVMASLTLISALLACWPTAGEAAALNSQLPA